LLAALLLAAAGAAFGQASEVAKPDPATETRLKTLAEELRCLVCQNQTIADSSAPLAVDLRNQIRGQIAEGRSDDQIRGYMVERYGDFVLYRPPFKASTLALWAGPPLLILLGLAIFFRVVRRRRVSEDAATVTPVRRAELEALLGDEPSPPPPTPPTARRKKGSSR
jgi:cytochrome c-type biogenesis protein CcmH